MTKSREEAKLVLEYRKLQREVRVLDRKIGKLLDIQSSSALTEGEEVHLRHLYAIREEKHRKMVCLVRKINNHGKLYES